MAEELLGLIMRNIWMEGAMWAGSHNSNDGKKLIRAQKHNTRMNSEP